MPENLQLNFHPLHGYAHFSAVNFILSHPCSRIIKRRDTIVNGGRDGDQQSLHDDNDGIVSWSLNRRTCLEFSAAFGSFEKESDDDYGRKIY